MARNPEQLNFVEASQTITRAFDQDLKPGDPGTVRSSHIAQGHVAVAVQQQMPGAGIEGHVECDAQRMQFGFVVAAGAAGHH